MVNLSTVVQLQRRSRRNALHASLRLRQRRVESQAATNALRAAQVPYQDPQRILGLDELP